MSSPTPHRHHLKRQGPHGNFVLFAGIAKAVNYQAFNICRRERKGTRKMKADKQVSSFRRKGTLPFLLIVGKADLKKKKKPASMVISGSKGNSKDTEARAAKPCCGPITRYRSMNGWPGLLLAGTHLVPPWPEDLLGGQWRRAAEKPPSPPPPFWKTWAALSNRWGGVCAGEHEHWVEEERPRDDRFGGNLL